MRILLPASATLNLLLITGMVLARVDQTREQLDDLAILPAEQPDSISWQPRLNSARELHDLLREVGLSEQTIRPLMFGWVVVASQMAVRLGPDPYWQPDYVPARTDMAERIAREERARDALLELYGPDAANEPAFAPLFRPLGSTLAFLSSAQQLGLQRVQLESAAQPLRQRPTVCLQEASLSSSAAQQSHSDWLAGLDDADRLEYQLRFSAQAQRLRESGAVTEEPDFRRAFEVARLLDGTLSPGSLYEVRRDLRASLGDAAFDRFWGRHDPFYAELENYLAAQGSTADQIAAAYAVINESQDALLRALGRREGTAQLNEVASTARQKEHARLVQILGQQTAERLRAKQSEIAMNLGKAGGRC